MNLTFSRVKEFVATDGRFRLALLLLLVVYAYFPFLSGKNMGADDARWYQYILHDAILQFNHGIFPNYVGQSLFTSFGGPIIRAPYYLLLGQFIDLISLSHLSALVVQHLTVFLSAVLAALCSYFAFTHLAPKYPWLALVFSLFYVSCPGVLGVIYTNDAYYSFVALPFIPLALYGLVRSSLKQDRLAYLLTALALALIWMAHPPIALWMTAVCFLFYGLRLLMLRKGLLAIPLVSVVILALCFWQFAAIYHLNLGSDYVSTAFAEYLEHYASAVVKILRAEMPGVFLPLSHQPGQQAFMQLGYALWLVFMLSCVAKASVENRFVQGAFLGIALLFMLLLYPLPYVGHFLWSLIPRSIANITNVFPQIRFYMILAAFVSFAGFLVLAKLYASSTLKMKKLLSLLLFSLVAWNIYQSYFFIELAEVRKSAENSWVNEENIYFYPNHVLAQHRELFMGVHDPRLKAKLLDSQFVTINAYDNEGFVRGKCSQQQLPLTISPAAIDINKPAVTLNPSTTGWHVVCLSSTIDPSLLIKLELINPNHYYDLNLPKAAAKEQQELALPFYVRPSDKNQIHKLFIENRGEGNFELQSYGLAQYAAEELPIQILSYTPFVASVQNPSANSYLQLFKEYYPGYEAKVNGQPVSVMQTPDKYLLIPLLQKGLNQIELVYVGTQSMQMAFKVSAAAWFLLGTYLLYHRLRRRRLNSA